MLQLLRRMFKHRWLDESDARRAIPAEMAERLRARVAASESRHSGEIRIYIEAGLPLSYLWRKATARERAVAMFGRLRVWDTQDNNGVLIYLLLAERAIELVADRGLNQCVAPAEWQAMVSRMGAAFTEGRYEDGLTQAIAEVSALLVQNYPSRPGQANVNELPDAPVIT
ncbi:MAG: TPM domain-containing protein [Bdellovibrionales bacterium]|nr:TPM domain-containing protein [Ramlibacter sp.]